MNEAALATAAATQLAASPMSDLWAFLLLIGALSLIGVPIFLKLRAGGQKDAAEGKLYAQLSETVAKLKEDLEKVTRQRDEEKIKSLEKELINKSTIIELEARVKNLESCEELLMTLKRKLDEKDMVIKERNATIDALREELKKMEDRVDSLEKRLDLDEKTFCSDCDRFKNKGSV